MIMFTGGGVPAPGEGVPAPRGVWSRRVVPAPGGVPAPTGVWSWGGLLQAHTQGGN